MMGKLTETADLSFWELADCGLIAVLHRPELGSLNLGDNCVAGQFVGPLAVIPGYFPGEPFFFVPPHLPHDMTSQSKVEKEKASNNNSKEVNHPQPSNSYASLLGSMLIFCRDHGHHFDIFCRVTTVE